MVHLSLWGFRLLGGGFYLFLVLSLSRCGWVVVYLAFVKVRMDGLWSVFPFRGIGDWVVVSLYLSFSLSLSLSGWLGGGLCLSLSLYISSSPYGKGEQAGQRRGHFRGSLLGQAFLNRQGKLTYKSDAHAEPFRQQRKHVAARRPPVALLVATDFWELTRTALKDVMGLF